MADEGAAASVPGAAAPASFLPAYIALLAGAGVSPPVSAGLDSGRTEVDGLAASAPALAAAVACTWLVAAVAAGLDEDGGPVDGDRLGCPVCSS